MLKSAIAVWHWKTNYVIFLLWWIKKLQFNDLNIEETEFSNLFLWAPISCFSASSIWLFQCPKGLRFDEKNTLLFSLSLTQSKTENISVCAHREWSRKHISYRSLRARSSFTNFVVQSIAEKVNGKLDHKYSSARIVLQVKQQQHWKHMSWN
jgi:hypothetical protein